MKLFFGLLSSYALTVWEGFAIKTLWAWFVAGQFHLPELGIAQGAGIALLVGLVTHQAPSDMSEDDRIYKVLAWATFGPAVTLLVGLILKQFL